MGAGECLILPAALPALQMSSGDDCTGGTQEHFPCASAYKGAPGVFKLENAFRNTFTQPKPVC